MTERAPDFHAVETWIGASLPLVGLHDWRITVSRTPAESDAWAEVEVHSSEKDATLSLSPNFWTLNAERQRAILVHELVHVVAAPLDRVSETLEPVLGSLAFSIYEPAHTQAMEVVVWRFAELLAPRFPAFGTLDQSTSRRRR